MASNLVEKQREALRALSQSEYAALQELCESNGISEDQLVHRAHEVSTLEMFMYNFPKMCCLYFFPNITTLCIMQQNITKIETLESCVNLENCWLNENRIEKLEGLHNCVNLKHLYLYTNRIKRIENLTNLTKLERLWLCDNQIPRIEGLQTLYNLSEVNFSRNKIERIGDVFKHNPKLTSINFSDNGIGSFKEVCHLARLPHLTELCLSDPHWGDNPLSSLCNYQTYVLFNIQQLTSLDTLTLAEETKQLAEATYMKKKMYYNMRIKTLRRNTTNALRRAQEGKAMKVGQANQMLNTLIRQQKDIEREIEETKYYHKEEDQGQLGPLEAKCEVLKGIVERKAKEVADTENFFDECKRRVYEMSDQYVRRLMVELETGGNIRMEDGRPGDLWYKSCVDLLHSRFLKEDFATCDVTGLRVTRVTRIHNRFLRNRFEAALESMVDVSDPSYKRSLEYLFFGDNPSMPGELQRATEDGFRHPHEYAALTCDGAVCLSNSVSLSDLPRLMMRREQMKKQSQSYRSHKSWATGQVLVTKVFLGKSVQEMNVVQARRAMKDSPLKDTTGPKGEAIRILPEMYPEHNSVFRMKPSDPKQRLWFVFNHALVLPEYIVEFEYDIKPGSSGDVPEHQSTTDARAQGELENLEFDIRQISRPIVPFLVYASEAQKERDKDKDQPKADGGEHGDGASSPISRPHLAEESYLNAINMPPHIPPRPKVFMMTEELILKHTQCSNLLMVTYLNLHGNNIRKIEALQNLVNLKVLVASFNEIVRIEGLADLKRLERVELGFNFIKRIEGLRGLTSLIHFELNNNLIYRLEDINVLKKYVPSLTHLNLRNNTICENKTYRGLVLRRLSQLKNLDGCHITEHDHALACENSSTLTVQLIRDNSFCQRRTMWSLAGAHTAGPEEKVSKDDEDWWETVEEVVVEHQRVRRLQNLERLTKMRRGSFCDNELTRIEGLEFCTSLEELSLEDNRIMQVDGLSTLTNLKMLDLGKNKISKCENLDTLAWLTQLSMEDNEIESLQGLSKLSCLMELYIGNNKVSEMREVQQLKELPKLIILDLLGNPLCTTQDYRLYVVYHLRKLKVLDGMGIEASEQAAAKSKYAGKLTLDFLEERVGHRFFEHLRELDLSGFRIRDLGRVFVTDDFNCLRELNLDNNFVSDISSLCFLTNLVALRVNHNRIENNPIFDEAAVVNTMVQKAKEEHGEDAQPPAGQRVPCFDSLEVLQMGYNNITNVALLQLYRLKHSLKILFLQDNEIYKLEGIDQLINLQELVLDRNKIKFLDNNSLMGLMNLQELHMEENGLRSLNNFFPLKHLKCLHLGLNRVIEVNELEKLAAHTELVELTLSNNPVARKQVYRPMLVKKVPSLRVIDGRDVTQEERDHVEMLFAPSDGMNVVGREGFLAATNVNDRATIAKVPIKLTSMNFESLIVPSHQPLAQPALGLTMDMVNDASQRLQNATRPDRRSTVAGMGRPGSGGRPSSNERDSQKYGPGSNAGGGNTGVYPPTGRTRTMSMLRNYYRHSGV